MASRRGASLATRGSSPACVRPIAGQLRWSGHSACGPPSRLLGLALGTEPTLALGEIHFDLGVIASPGQVVVLLTVSVDVALDRTTRRRGLVVLRPPHCAVVPSGSRLGLPNS